MIPFLVVSFAWFFQSLTGFGAGIFIVGILSMLYDPKMVVVSSAVFNLFGTLGLLYQNRRGKVERYLMFSLLIGSVPGILLGANLLDRLENTTLKLVIGLFILCLGVYDFFVQRGFLKIRLSRHMGFLSGFLGGLFAGLVGMGGPPPLVFLNQHMTDHHSIRLMLNLYFSSNILFRLAFYWHLEVVSLDWGFVGMGMAGLFVGMFLGGLLSRRVSAETYKSGVSYAVMLLGFVMLSLWWVEL